MVFCRENCANGDDKPQIIASHHHAGSWLHLMSGTAGASESKKCPASLLTVQDAVSRLSRPQGCSIPKPVPGSMPFGQGRSQEDQIQLFVGNIIPKAPEIKKHRLKKLRGTVGVKSGRSWGRSEPGSGWSWLELGSNLNY